MSAGRRAEKAELRKAILARRDALPATLRVDYSARITRTLLGLGHYQAARCVAAYSSFGSEFESTAFIREVLAQGKRLVLPRINEARENLEMRSVSDPGRDLVPGTWGIQEPAPERCAQVALNQLDFVLVPGLAFTERGARLGYGKGFYDRLIAGLNENCWLVAAAFSCQLVPTVPTTETDQRVHLVVTEAGVLTA